VKGQLIWLGFAILLLAVGCSTAAPETDESPTAGVGETPTPGPVENTPTPSVAPRTSTPSPPPETPTSSPEPATATAAPAAATAAPPAEGAASGDLANVISVEVRGGAGAYQFSVGIESPDTGCDQYADWWEVVGEAGELIYRRVLLHSHVGEQAFVRSGGPVAIEASTVVWVRAHMNTAGYGGAAFRGSVQEGFQEAELSPDFAADLADVKPLPDGCAF